MDDLCLNTTDPAAPPPPPIADSEARAILWCLSELNFIFELFALNKRAGPADRDEFEHDQAVRNALHVKSLQAVDMDTSNIGIRSTHWQSRLPSLL
jgi:hypothetical protein